MIILVFDTETTGLPEGRNPSPEDTTKFPHIVQLSYLLYDTDLDKTLACEDHIIKLKASVTLPPESVRIHGINRNRMMRKGVTIKYALDDFIKAMRKADTIVGHNLRFDKNMLVVEAKRNNRTIAFETKREYCTMLNSVDICQIERTNREGKKYYKFPNLSELHMCLFEEMPRGVHDSMADVLFTLRCFLVLTQQHDVECKRLKRLYRLYDV